MKQNSLVRQDRLFNELRRHIAMGRQGMEPVFGCVVYFMCMDTFYKLSDLLYMHKDKRP